ncbi:MAG: putative DNA-binding domain-containing protein [Proteobacteria bacterium]|nr:putative DNA-binding domain-containing protein [Pseudomonadota bacterium]
MSLKELQESFIKAFDSGQEKNQFTQFVKAKHLLSAEKGFSIYLNSIRGGLTSGLSIVFPACKNIVGEDFFNKMALSYIQETPSYSPDVGEYGKYFSEFIKRFPPASHLSYLSDVAKLEWAWHKAFNGLDAKSLDFAKLQDIDVEETNNIQFFMPENASLIESEYPILHIWTISQDDYQGDEVVHLEEGGEYLIVWRKGLEVFIERLTEPQWQLLQAIQMGKTISEIANEFSGDLTQLLPELTSCGWVTDFEVES